MQRNDRYFLNAKNLFLADHKLHAGSLIENLIVGHFGDSFA